MTDERTVWELGRNETAPNLPADEMLMMLISPAADTAPVLRNFGNLRHDFDLFADRFEPGFIERAQGHSLPATERVSWADGTVPPVTILSPLTFQKAITTGMIVGVEMSGRGSGGGTRPDLTLDLRDPNGNIVSTRIAVQPDGDVRYHQLEITANPPVTSVSLALEGVDGGGSGDFFFDVHDVLGFTGTGAGARLVAQIADRLINLEAEMGLTQQEIIALIQSMLPDGFDGDPSAVAGSSVAGHSSALARGDHVHAGVTVPDFDTVVRRVQDLENEPEPVDPFVILEAIPYSGIPGSPTVSRTVTESFVDLKIQSSDGTRPVTDPAEWATQIYPDSSVGSFKLVSSVSTGDLSGDPTKITLPHGFYEAVLEYRVDVSGTMPAQGVRVRFLVNDGTQDFERATLADTTVLVAGTGSISTQEFGLNRSKTVWFTADLRHLGEFSGSDSAILVPTKIRLIRRSEPKISDGRNTFPT